MSDGNPGMVWVLYFLGGGEHTPWYSGATSSSDLRIGSWQYPGDHALRGLKQRSPAYKRCA